MADNSDPDAPGAAEVFQRVLKLKTLKTFNAVSEKNTLGLSLAM